MTLLVAGPEVEEQCRQLGMPLAAPLAEGWALPTKPRCLHLTKGPKGFGFLLREDKGLDGRPGEPELRRWVGEVCLGVGTHTGPGAHRWYPWLNPSPELFPTCHPPNPGSVPRCAHRGLGWCWG